jgi:hypothetical protein
MQQPAHNSESTVESGVFYGSVPRLGHTTIRLNVISVISHTFEAGSNTSTVTLRVVGGE